MQPERPKTGSKPKAVRHDMQGREIEDDVASQDECVRLQEERDAIPPTPTQEESNAIASGTPIEPPPPPDGGVTAKAKEPAATPESKSGEYKNREDRSR